MYICIYVCVYMHIYMYTCICSRHIHVYINTYIYIYTHTHTYAHTSTVMWPGARCSSTRVAFSCSHSVRSDTASHWAWQYHSGMLCFDYSLKLCFYAVDQCMWIHEWGHFLCTLSMYVAALAMFYTGYCFIFNSRIRKWSFNP